MSYNEKAICDDCNHEYYADRMTKIEGENGMKTWCGYCVMENDTYGQ